MLGSVALPIGLLLAVLIITSVQPDPGRRTDPELYADTSRCTTRESFRTVVFR
jgi:hypothetical protein